MGASPKKTGWLHVKLTRILKRLKEAARADRAHGVLQDWTLKAFRRDVPSSFLQGPSTPAVWRVA